MNGVISRASWARSSTGPVPFTGIPETAIKRHPQRILEGRRLVRFGPSSIGTRCLVLDLMQINPSRAELAYRGSNAGDHISPDDRRDDWRCTL